MKTGSPSLDNVILPMVASAYQAMKASREAGDTLGGVISLLVAARIIEADVRAMLTPGPDPVQLQLAEAEARRAIERIYTEGWVRH